MRRVDPRIPLALTLLFASCGVAAWRTGLFEPRRPAPARGVLTRNDLAPELTGISRWINSPPLTLRSLRGKVVIVDFWTYSCVNCVRTFPELRAFYERYRPAGLEIVGVHSPEFSFEKDPANVARAAREKGVVWPVALDNAMKTWRAFRNRWWPHVYVIDRSGRIRFDRIGEGGGAAIEAAIRRLLRTPGRPLPPPVREHASGPSAGITAEIYCGYERGEAGGHLGNDEPYRRDRVAEYRIPDAAGPIDARATFFLGGRWRASREAVVAAERGARIVVPFTARDVYAVAGGGATVRLFLDGEPLPARWRGSGIAAGTARGIPRDLYHLVRLPRVETHELTVVANGEGAAFYTFTFG